MKLAIRACALFLVVAFNTQTVWPGGHGSGSHSSGSRSVHVNGYTRKDGTYVHAYDRAAPGTAGVGTSAIKSSSAYVPATSSPNITSLAAVPFAVAPAATPDSRSNKQIVQDAIAAGRIVVSDPGTVHVNGYLRRDGTYENGYDRAASSTSTLPPSSRSTSASVPAVIGVAKTTPRSYMSTSRYSTSTGVQRDSHGKIKRSESAKHEFEQMTGYPHGRPGYVVDHIIPLKRGGCDCPSNMQWQTIQEAKAKDKVE
jgi:hypothetical protein